MLRLVGHAAVFVALSGLVCSSALCGALHKAEKHSFILLNMSAAVPRTADLQFNWGYLNLIMSGFTLPLSALVGIENEVVDLSAAWIIKPKE